MTFKATVDSDDIVAFNEDYVAMTFGRTIARNRWVSAASAGLISGTVLWLLISRESPISGIIVGATVGLVTFLTMPSIQKDRVRKLVRQAYDATKDVTVIGTHRHHIGPDGIRSETEHSDSLYRWSAIQRIRRVRGRIFIYVGPSKAIVIPCASLSGASADEVVEAVKSHVPDVIVDSGDTRSS